MSVWTAEIKENQLSYEAIFNIFQLQRSFIYCRCKNKYEGHAGFLFCLQSKSPSKIDYISPLKRMKKVLLKS